MKNRVIAPFFCDAEDVSSNPATLEVLGGIYSGLLLRIAGTNGSSYDPAASYGVIRVDMGRHPFVNIDWGNMRIINNYFGGLPLNTAGTTFAASIIIPFAIPGEDSALWVNDGEIKVYAPSAGTTTANLEVYGILDPDKPQRYLLHTMQETETLTANFVKKFSDINLSHVVLFAPATTNPTNVEIVIGRRNIKVCDTDWEPLVDFTDMVGEVEAASLACGIIDLNPTGDLGYAINQGVSLREIGGVGAQEIVTMSYQTNPLRFHETLNRVSLQAVDVSGGGIVQSVRRIETPTVRAARVGPDRRVAQGANPADRPVPFNPDVLLNDVSSFR